MEDFFSAIDQTALRLHWDYRKPFWLAYLNGGYISDAWVVYDPRTTRIAVNKLGIQDDQFGTIRSGSRSAILMKIKNLTILEWSNQGACRIWRAHDPDAPKLHKKTYKNTELMESCMRSIAHQHSRRGSWQDKIALIIQQETGIYMDKYSYMPEDYVRLSKYDG